MFVSSVFFCHLCFGGFTEIYREQNEEVVQGSVIVRDKTLK